MALTAANDALPPSGGSVMLGADLPLITQKGQSHENPDSVFQ